MHAAVTAVCAQDGGNLIIVDKRQYIPGSAGCGCTVIPLLCKGVRSKAHIKPPIVQKGNCGMQGSHIAHGTCRRDKADGASAHKISRFVHGQSQDVTVLTIL